MWTIITSLALALVGCPGKSVTATLDDGGLGQDGGPDGGDGSGCDDICSCPVPVPAGPFEMGAAVSPTECESPADACVELPEYCDHGPAHEVFLSEFRISRYRATAACYQACVDSGECSTVPTMEERGDAFYPPSDYWTSPGDELRPAYGLRYEQARSYCASLGGRLPTEAEWEKAGRGEDGRLFPWGDDVPTCDDADLGHGRTVGGDSCPVETATLPLPVTSRPRDESPFGVRGLAGGVFEWVSDYYDDVYYSFGVSPGDEWRDPMGPEECCPGCYNRVLRGQPFFGFVGSDAVGSGELFQRQGASTDEAPLTGVRCAWDPK